MTEEMIASALMDVHVALPGKVQSYDADTQTVEIELQTQRLMPTTDGEYVPESLPILPNVPVMFPRSKDFFISFPIAAGDTGLVVFNETSIDQWRSSGNKSNPIDIGRHTCCGGVFIPGLFANKNSISQTITGDAILGNDGGANVRVKDDNTVHVTQSGGTTSPEFTAMANLVDDFISRIDTVIRTAWVVPPVPDGGAALKAAYIASFTLPPTTTASDSLKADGPPGPV